MIVVVDGLDECNSEEGIETILQLWSQLVDIKTIRLRLFLTSRPDPPIRLKFRQFPTKFFQNVILQDAVPPRTIEQDLLTYLRDAFKDIRLQVELDMAMLPSPGEDWPGEAVLRTLVDMAVPLFIVAATIRRFVGDKEFDPIERLEQVLASRLTSQMEPMQVTYMSVLKHLTAAKRTEAEISRLCTDFQAVVGSIICLIEPLSITDLSCLLKRPVSSIVRCLHPLHAVLHVPDDPLFPVRIFHSSFAEFLSGASTQNEPFAVHAPATHLILVQRCLELLTGSDGLHQNLCGLDDPGTLRRDIDPVLIQSRLPPALQYACQYWVVHLLQSQALNDELHNVGAFFDEHFLHWLEAMSLMDRLSDVVNLLDVLQSHVSGGQLSLLLEDARRFILANRHLADLAPLQVYSSALLFAPVNSHTRSVHFSKLEWIRQNPRTTPAWGLELQNLEGHTGPVQNVAFAHDNSLLASGSDDLTIRLWQPSSGKEIQRLEGHDLPINVVAFSHDDIFIASASRDMTIRVWHTATGQEIINKAMSREVVDLEFSPRSSLLALTSEGGAINFLDPSTGVCSQAFPLKGKGISSFAFAYEKPLVASAGPDGNVRIWHETSRKMVLCLNGNARRLPKVAISRDGSMVAAPSEGDTIRLRETSRGDLVSELDGHDGFLIVMLAFSPDGGLLATAGDDMTVRLWTTEAHCLLHSLTGHDSTISSLAFSQDGLQLATASHDHTVRLWNTAAGQGDRQSGGHAEAITDVVLAHDGSMLASASVDGTIILWHTDHGAEHLRLSGHGSPVLTIRFSSNDKFLVSASADGDIWLWNSVTGRFIRQFPGHMDAVNAVAFSHEGSIVASASDDETVILWAVLSGHQIRRFNDFGGPAIAVAFSKDDSLVVAAFGASDMSARIWHVDTGTQLRTFEATESIPWVLDAAISHNNTYLALVSRSVKQGFSSIQIWNLFTGKVSETLHDIEHTDRIEYTSNSNVLLTNRGLLGLGYASESEDLDYLEIVEGVPRLSVKDHWLRYKGKRFLWLPRSHLQNLIIQGNIVASSYDSRQVSVLRISEHDLPLSINPPRASSPQSFSSVISADPKISDVSSEEDERRTTERPTIPKAFSIHRRETR